MYPRRPEPSSFLPRNDAPNLASRRPLPSLSTATTRPVSTLRSSRPGQASSSPVKTIDGIHPVSAPASPAHPSGARVNYTQQSFAVPDSSATHLRGRTQTQHMDMVLPPAPVASITIAQDTPSQLMDHGRELRVGHPASVAQPATIATRTAPGQTPSASPPLPPELPLPESLHLDNPKSAQSPAASTLDKIYKGIRLGGFFGGFIGIVIGGAALLNAFVFQSYYVDGLSMQPTLGDDDRLIVSKIERTAAQLAGGEYVPKRGQIVVIDSNVSSITQARNEQIIKRIIGLPGDTVKINSGIVKVYNADHPEGFDIDKTLDLKVPSTFTTSPVNITVPPDHVFVLGDNRAEGGSLDSRIFGPVSTDLVKGRLAIRVLPLSEAGIF